MYFVDDSGAHFAGDVPPRCLRKSHHQHRSTWRDEFFEAFERDREVQVVDHGDGGDYVKALSWELRRKHVGFQVRDARRVLGTGTSNAFCVFVNPCDIKSALGERACQHAFPAAHIEGRLGALWNEIHKGALVVDVQIPAFAVGLVQVWRFAHAAIVAGAAAYLVSVTLHSTPVRVLRGWAAMWQSGSVTLMPTPAAETALDTDRVRALLTAQHPDLASLPLGNRMDGWDNAMFRLGDNLAVRMPRRELAATLTATELDWLPRIGRNWTFPIPLPVRTGEPGEGYPWRWSVVPWIVGEHAYDAPLTVAGARDLGAAIAQIQTSSAADAPINPYRSGTLVAAAEIFHSRVQNLEHTGDITGGEGDKLREVFAAGAATPEPERVCAHLDLHGENVLTVRGRLAGIIDWGDAAAADPATDLGQACVLVGPTHANLLLAAYETANGPLHVGAGRSERDRVIARGAAYAVTLASMADDPYRGAGLAAIRHWYKAFASRIW